MTLFSGVIAFNTSSSGLKAAHSYCIKTTTSFTGKFVILELLVFVVLDRAKSLHALGPGVGGGGVGEDYSTMCYTGRLRPEVQPFNLLYTIFDRRGTLSYTFY